MTSTSRASLRVLALLAVCCAWTADARAGTLVEASDFAALCDHARPVADVFSMPIAFGAMTMEPKWTALDDEIVALTTRAVPEHAWGAHDEPCSDPVVAVLRAREYAQRRGGLLLESYDVAVDASAFELDDSDVSLGILRVPLVEGIGFFGDTYALVFDTDAIAFDVEQREAEDLIARHAIGSLSLRLRFTIATRREPLEPYCVAMVDDATRIAAQVVSAELVEPLTQVRRAGVRSAAWVDEHVRRVAAEASAASTELRPTIEVTSIEVTGTRGCEADEATVVQTTLETLWIDCYVRALASNTRLQGALVVEFDVDDAGRVGGFEITTDMLQNDVVTSCAEDVMRSLRLSAASDEPWLVRTTVMFRPTPQTGLR